MYMHTREATKIMINVAIVGYGDAGRRYHSYLISLVEGLNLHAVATRDADRRRAATTKYGVKVYTTIDDLLKDDGIGLVVVATPHDTHAEFSIKAMEAGKHVVTDKAMCMNVSECDAMIEASKQNNVMLSVFHNRRLDWDFSTVKKVLAERMIGTPYYFETGVMQYAGPIGWRTEKARVGGILYDWGAHFIDQMLQLVSDKVEKVFCEIQYRGWGKDVGSYAKLLTRFSNGVLYQIEIGNLAAGPRPRWYILGEEGTFVKFGMDPQEEAMFNGNIDAAKEDPEHRSRIFTDGSDCGSERTIDSVRSSWKEYYQNISDVLNKGAQLAVTPEEIRRVMLVIEAATLSAETGQAVNADI